MLCFGFVKNCHAFNFGMIGFKPLFYDAIKEDNMRKKMTLNVAKFIWLMLILSVCQPGVAQNFDRESSRKEILKTQELLEEENFDEALLILSKLEEEYQKPSALLLALKARAYLGRENYLEARNALIRFYELGSSSSFMKEMRKYVQPIEKGYSKQLTEVETPLLDGEYLQPSDSEPEIIGGINAFFSKIKYPEKASRAGITGVVILDFLVDENGAPTEIVVSEGIGWGCDSSAVNALQQVKYKPAILNSEAVARYQSLAVNFEKGESDK